MRASHIIRLGLIRLAEKSQLQKSQLPWYEELVPWTNLDDRVWAIVYQRVLH